MLESRWEELRLNFTLDNADIDIRTLNKQNTRHGLGGIVCKTLVWTAPLNWN